MKKINKQGFTLIELLAVITILGILMMLAIPSVSRTIEKSRKEAFLDIAKTYVNSAKNLWTADGLSCGSDQLAASSVVNGDYFILIDTSSNTITSLVEEGAKSPWGGGELKGYVRISKDENENKPNKYYIALTDGRHAIYDDPDNPIQADKLKVNDIIQDISADEDKLKLIQTIPFENGKFTTCSEESATWTGNASFESYGENNNITIISGTGTNVGDEISIGTEHFNVISTEGENINIFAKYNLLVGNKTDDTNGAVPLTNPSGVQDPTAKGWFSGYTVDNPKIGTVGFTNNLYWSGYGYTYPAYLYDSNSLVYPYVENYKNHIITSYGITVIDARLIKLEELQALGCRVTNGLFSDNCDNAPDWLHQTSFWTGSGDGSRVWVLNTSNNLYYAGFRTNELFGVRPIITIPKSLLTN